MFLTAHFVPQLITNNISLLNIKQIVKHFLTTFKKINLEKIKTLKIFRWLKSQGVSDQEMLKTFNCGVGFCLIVKRSNYKKVIRLFPKKYKPYVIGKITKNSEKVKLSGKVIW